MTLARASALAFALATGAALAALPKPSQAQVLVDIRARIAPPPLPVYAQPALPGQDYIWTPGYWAWDEGYADYYWVPGTWVRAPRPGYLWTPNYWAWDDGNYVFRRGYWGPHIGYYGGVNYGFGYTGFGFEGGYWNGPHYFYNRAVNNVSNVNISNVYSKTVIVNRKTINNVSYNGGPGGVVARPTSEQQAAAREIHVQATTMQMQHVEAAHTNRALFASVNHGAPPVAASVRPAQFSGPGIVRAQHAPAGKPGPLQNRGAAGTPGAHVAGAHPAAAPKNLASSSPRPLDNGQPVHPSAARSPLERSSAEQVGRPPVRSEAFRSGQAYPKSGLQPFNPREQARPEGAGNRKMAPAPGVVGQPHAPPQPRAQPPRPPVPRPPAPRPAAPRPHPEPHGEPKGQPRHES